MNNNEVTPKCYNSFACVSAVLIIFFILGSIVWDICISKPAMKSSIEEIRIEVKDIHESLEQRHLLEDTTKISLEFENNVVNIQDSLK